MSINYSNNVTSPISQMSDYRHAARIFTDSNFRLSPKYGFLFYVEFDLNQNITNINNVGAAEMGMIVKSVNLPKYTVQVKEHNAYNRKNYVQNSIKYEPVTITFHDDQSDTVRNFWYDYYSYFYRDSDYADSTYDAPTKYQSRPTFDWGYSPRPAVGYSSSKTMAQPYQYIQGIRIYSLYQQQFSEYQLVNPTITSFKHGEHKQGNEGGTLEHEMSVQFETVKYLNGSVTNNTVGGFIDLHYDNQPSPLAPGNFVPGTNVPQEAVNLSSHYIPSGTAGTTGSAPATVNYSTGSGFPSAYGAATLAASRARPNSGGFNVPSFGSLSSVVSGVPSSVQIGNQLKAAGVNVASNAVNTFSNGVVTGVTNALGPNGGAIVGLVTQTLHNPSAVLKTVEGMAVNYATAAVGNFVNQKVSEYTSQASTYVQNTVSAGLSTLNNSAGAAVFGDGSTFTAGLQNTYNDLSYSLGLGSGSGFQNIDGINVPFSALND